MLRRTSWHRAINGGRLSEGSRLTGSAMGIDTSGPHRGSAVACRCYIGPVQYIQTTVRASCGQLLA